LLVEQTQNYTTADIQNWLNSNKNTGLDVDGKIGPLTLKAIKNALIG
jgi:lysozyme family protein